MCDVIRSIHELHSLAGVNPPKHPLFSIHRIENLRDLSDNFPKKFSYNFYGISLKKNLSGYIKYGRTVYDFQEGALGFTEPYQVLEFNDDLMVNATGWIMFLHKDFLLGTSLNSKIDGYGFFKYATNEGLHLSKDEEDALHIVFRNIEKEYKQPLDKYSKPVVISNFELILVYSQRYYARQFIVRNEVEDSLVHRFKSELQQIFGDVGNVELPSVELLAKRLNISPNYLSDFLKTTTGKTAIEHIHEFVISLAKSQLLLGHKSISEIAFELGFEYPHYFSRLFKKKTGFTPSEFRTTLE